MYRIGFGGFGPGWLWRALLLAVITGSEAAVFKDAPMAPDFALKRADRGEYRLQPRAGRVALLYFGFTNCADVCPRTIGALSMLAARLTPEERSRTDLVFVSVDPERDSPEQVRAFLSRFKGHYIGLMPDEVELDQLRNGYNLAVRRLQGPGRQDYDLVHTDLVYVVGPKGHLRHAFFAGTSVDAMLKDMRALLSEGP